MIFKFVLATASFLVAAWATPSPPPMQPLFQEHLEPVVLGELPDGSGRETTAILCTQCHSIGMVTSQRHTREEWDEIVSRMVNDFGLMASGEQRSEIAAYLAAEFGRSAA
jgi:hypothetical protein